VTDFMNATAAGECTVVDSQSAGRRTLAIRALRARKLS